MCDACHTHKNIVLLITTSRQRISQNHNGASPLSSQLKEARSPEAPPSRPTNRSMKKKHLSTDPLSKKHLLCETFRSSLTVRVAEFACFPFEKQRRDEGGGDQLVRGSPLNNPSQTGKLVGLNQRCAQIKKNPIVTLNCGLSIISCRRLGLWSGPAYAHFNELASFSPLKQPVKNCKLVCAFTQNVNLH